MIEINRNPSRRDLRVFAIGLTILLGLAGWWLRKRLEVELLFPLGLTLGAVVGLCGIVRPEALRPVYVGWMIVCSPIGWLVSYVLLGIVYYGVVTPLALVMRLRGRDPLDRTFDRQAPTYWKERTKKREPKSYFDTF